MAASISEVFACAKGTSGASSGHGLPSAVRIARDPADRFPVLRANIFIDFDQAGTLRVEAILSVFPRPGNPIFVAGLHFKMIPLLAALALLEFLPAILDRPTGLRESNAANSGGSVERLGLSLDVHDPGFLGAHWNGPVLAIVEDHWNRTATGPRASSRSHGSLSSFVRLAFIS